VEAVLIAEESATAPGRLQTSGVGNDEIHGHVMGLGRHVVDEALGETHADARHAGSEFGEEPVIPAAPLAEPVTGCGEGNPGHHDQVDRRRVGFLFGHDDGEAEVPAVIGETREVDFAGDGVVDHDGAGGRCVGFKPSTDDSRAHVLVGQAATELSVVGAQFRLGAGHVRTLRLAGIGA